MTITWSNEQMVTSFKPKLAIKVFEAMFDTVSVAPDSANQLRTIILRKRQNRRPAIHAVPFRDCVEQPVGQPSSQSRNETMSSTRSPVAALQQCEEFYAAGDFWQLSALSLQMIWRNWYGIKHGLKNLNGHLRLDVIRSDDHFSSDHHFLRSDRHFSC